MTDLASNNDLTNGLPLPEALPATAGNDSHHNLPRWRRLNHISFSPNGNDYNSSGRTPPPCRIFSWHSQARARQRFSDEPDYSPSGVAKKLTGAAI
jgi:hypothetical protein